MSILVHRIAENIKYYRKLMSISQEQLAELSGLSVGMIGKIETEAASPSLHSLEMISNSLSIDPSLLFHEPERGATEEDDIDSMVNDYRLFLRNKYNRNY